LEHGGEQHGAGEQAADYLAPGTIAIHDKPLPASRKAAKLAKLFFACSAPLREKKLSVDKQKLIAR
jgi:hypothetical protein